MNNKKAKLILHPVRMEIIQTLAGGKKLSVSQIAKRISNVPHATLYRQINTLYKAGLLYIVEQNQIRGTVEKIYSLCNEAESVSLEEMKSFTKEDHINVFTRFLTGVLNDFSAYLDKESPDLIHDGAGYRQAILYLDDEEFKEFAEDLKEVFMKYHSLEPSPNRTKRKITTILFPDEMEA